MKITKTVTVEVSISGRDLLLLFVDTIKPEAEAATGKEFLCWRAFAHLIGISDAEAVEAVNEEYPDGMFHITVEEFRQWLPTVFAQFAEAVVEGNRDG